MINLKTMSVLFFVILLSACNGNTESTDELTSEIVSVSENAIEIDCEEYIQHPDGGEASPSVGYTDQCTININQDTVITNGTKETLTPGTEVTVILPSKVDIREDDLSSFSMTGEEIIVR